MSTSPISKIDQTWLQTVLVEYQHRILETMRKQFEPYYDFVTGLFFIEIPSATVLCIQEEEFYLIFSQLCDRLNPLSATLSGDDIELLQTLLRTLFPPSYVPDLFERLYHKYQRRYELKCAMLEVLAHTTPSLMAVLETLPDKTTH